MDRQSVRRKVLAMTGSIALASTSGCIDYFTDDNEGDNSDSDSQGGSSGGGETTQRPPRDQNDADTSEDTNTPDNTSDEAEPEPATPEPEPENDPSDVDPAENTSEPTQDDLRLVDDDLSVSSTKASVDLTIENTSDQRIRTLDVFVTFYDETESPIGDAANGVTGINAGETETITVTARGEQFGNTEYYGITRVLF